MTRDQVQYVEVERYPVGETRFVLCACRQEGSELVIVTQENGREYERFAADRWYEARFYVGESDTPRAYFANPTPPERESVRPPVKAVA